MNYNLQKRQLRFNISYILNNFWKNSIIVLCEVLSLK